MIKLKNQVSMQNKSIVYLNYSPYENSGHILDYLIENYHRVYLFSIAFHPVGNRKSKNKLIIYGKGKIVREELLPYIEIPESLVLILIPIRSLINALQIIYKLVKIKREFGVIDIYFTVNAFTASLGRLLKRVGLVKHTVFWVWDYYPLEGVSLLSKIMRFIYWQFDKFATFSDKIVYLNHRIADVRKDAKVISRRKKITVIPIATGDKVKKKKKSFANIKLGFIGVLKQSQGIDMLLESAEEISSHFKKVTFEIIGSGPSEKEFTNRAKAIKTKNVKYNFYGLVSEKKFMQILSNSTIGVAPYSPDGGTVSKYTDPGKIKRYIEFNLPIITTDVIEFSSVIKKNKAGKIIEYGSRKDFVKAISEIIKNYDRYTNNISRLHDKYYYKAIYVDMFKGL